MKTVAGPSGRQPSPDFSQTRLSLPLFLFPFSHRIVILSGAPHRFTAWHSPCGAEPKDLGGAYLPHAVRSFSITEPSKREICRPANASRAKVVLYDPPAFLYDPDNRGMSRSKKSPELTSVATLAFGVNASCRATFESSEYCIGADPRTGLCL